MTPLDRVDSAINDAASRMTTATPSDALRANVMSRVSHLRAPRFGGQAGFARWRFLFAGGAIASVALVAFVMWPFNPTIPNPAISNPTIINALADPTVAVNDPSSLASVARTVAAHDSGQLALAAMVDAEQEWSNRIVPALEQPELLTVKPLFDGAPVKAIDIEPIRITPLMVRAIDDNQ